MEDRPIQALENRPIQALEDRLIQALEERNERLVYTLMHEEISINYLPAIIITAMDKNFSHIVMNLLRRIADSFELEFFSLYSEDEKINFFMTNNHHRGTLIMLYHAALKGMVHLTRTLLQSGLPIDDEVLISIIINTNNCGMIEMLLKIGWRPQTSSPHLEKAITKQSENVIAEMLKYPIVFSKDTLTVAIDTGNHRIVEMLVEAGIKISPFDIFYAIDLDLSMIAAILAENIN
jgi:hypothetical protein